MSKKMVSWLLVAGMVGLLASFACPIAAQAKTRLTYINSTGPRYGFAAKGMAKEYMKLHPDVDIVVETYPWEEYAGKIALDVAGGGAAYDIIWIDYKFIGGYADANYLLAFDTYLLQDPEFWQDLQSDIYDVVLGMYNYKGKWWAVPSDGNTQVFYYRQDVLDNAGVKVPTTWEEVFAAAPKIHNPPSFYAAGANLKRFWAADVWFAPFMSAGGYFWDENYVPTIDTPAGVEAAELILKLYKLCPPDAIGWAEADLYEAMGSAGVVGMAPAQWAGNVLTNPDAALLADKIGVTFCPKYKGKLVLPQGGFGLGINARSFYQDVAWDFIKFYMSRENQQLVVSYTGQPARVSALTDPVNVARSPYFAVLGKALKYAIPRPVIAEFSIVENIMGVELNKMMLGEKTPAQAVHDMNTEVYKVMQARIERSKK